MIKDLDSHATKAFCDSVIPMGRWYPFGRGDGPMVFPIRSVRAFDHDMIEYASSHGAREASLPPPMMASGFIRLVQQALPRAIERAENRFSFAERAGYPVGAKAEAKKDLIDLVAFATINTPLPIPGMPFESCVSADVVVTTGDHPPAGFDGWRYIDALTGGCCNSQMRSVSGDTFWEGTWPGDELAALIAEGVILKVVAASLRMTPQCEPLLSSVTRQALIGLPSPESWKAAYRADHDAWRAPRLERLLAALHGSALGDGVTLTIPPGCEKRVDADCEKNTLTVECLYRDADCARISDPDFGWQVSMTATFTPEGDLVSIAARDVVRQRDLMVTPARGGNSSTGIPRPRG